MPAPQHALYVPRIAIEWLTDDPDRDSLTIEGTVMFADISGFTALSERLMTEMGERGAEVVTRIMNAAFSELVEIVLLEHGDLLRFGGDAILSVFTGEDHIGHACRAADDMRHAIGEVETPGDPLGISIGLASGPITFDRVGGVAQELIVSGATVDRMLEAEKAANSGEIGIDDAIAAELPDDAFHRTHDHILLLEDPDLAPLLDDLPRVRVPDDLDPGLFISPDLRDRLTLTLQEGQHRTATIGFVKVSGLGSLSDAARHQALHRLFTSVIDRCGANAVSYLAADVDKDGAKFILAAGVPNRIRTKDGLAAALFEIVRAEPELAVSAGSAFGSIFAGDLGAPGRRCYTVMGDTVNLAARLAAAAPPGEVWTTAMALDRTAAVFETSKLEPIALKGKSMQIAPIRLDELSAHADEETAHDEVIGRQAEIASVARLIEVGLGGSGALIVITGEDGIGKGTIAAAAARGRAEIDTRLRCTLRWEGIHGIARRLVQLILGSAEAHSPHGLEIAIQKIAPHIAPWTPLIGEVLGVDAAPTPETESLPAEAYLHRLHETVVSLLVSALGERRAILRVEDALFADETSVGLLEMLAQTVTRHPWVMVVTAVDTPPWIPIGTSTVRVDRLDEDRARQFVLEALGDDTLPAPIIDEIIERAAGKPAALREMTSSALEGGAVPESIEAAALARIDRLDDRDRQLLSYASVFGMDARIDLLAALLPEMSTALEDPDSWERLQPFVDTEIVGRIRFRDAVHRDVAYRILPHERRMKLHALAGEAIERRARRRPERFVEDLAFHFHQAEDWSRSWEYGRMAADKALRGQAPLLAIRALDRVMAAAEHLTVDEDEIADTHERLGDAHERAGMFDRAVASYDRAMQLSSDPERAGRLEALAGRALVRLGKPDLARARFDAVLSRTTSASARAEALTGIAGMEIRKGHFEEAARWCDQVIQEIHEESAAVARAHYIRALASTQSGWPDAVDHAKRAVEIYESIGDVTGAANALNNLGYHAFYTGDWGECERCHRSAMAARSEIGDVLGRALASYNLGELLLEQGRVDESETFLLSALADFRGAGHLVGEAASRLTLGRLMARLGRVEEAERQFDRAEIVARSASADEQLVDVAFGRCELALLIGASEPGTALESIEIDQLSSIQRARWQLLSALCSPRDERRPLLEAAIRSATEVNALHLVQLGAETLQRLYGVGNERALPLSQRLEMRARPVFRLIA